MSELHGNTVEKMGSDRSFGLVFAVVFAIVALLPLVSGAPVRLWSLGLVVAFLVAAFFAPKLLRPLNLVWFRFGLLISKIMSPIVMAILFFVVVTPVGLIMRMFRPDPLKSRFDPDAETYWISIDPKIAAQSSMKNQF